MSAESASKEQHELRRGHLGVVGVAFFVISAAAPLTAMAGGAPTAMAFSNGPGIPFAYALVSLLLLVFAVGFCAMARFHTSTGAFYSFITRGFGQPVGGAAAMIALLGYNAMQIGLYGLFGAATAGFFEPFGISLPWYFWSLAALAIIAVLGYRQVDLSLKVLGLLVGLEFLVVLLFDLAVLVKGGGGGGTPLNFDSFTLTSLKSGSIALALLFCSAAFIGFEASTIYGEEAKDPARTVPRATYVSVLVIGIFYTFTSWLMVNAYGNPATLVDHLLSLKPDPTVFLFDLGTTYLGTFYTQTMSLLFATSVFAALLAFHNAVARYLFALGREGLLPEQLGHTHVTHLSPHKGSVSQSILAFVVIMIFLVTKRDPVNQLFVWLTNLGTLCILLLMALTSFSVVLFFRSSRGLDSNPWRTMIAPVLAGIGLSLIVIYATAQFGLLINDPVSPLRWVLTGLIPLFGVIGLVMALRLKKTSPEQYASMGRHRGEELVA